MKQTQLGFPEALTEKYKPCRIEDFVGLPKVKRTMTAFLRAPRPSAWLFLGPSGRGKTRMALTVATLLNAELHHIPSRNADLVAIQDTIATCHRSPWAFFGPNAGQPCRFHAVVMDEADQMTAAAQLELLSKTDETAFPPSTIFFFTANNTERLEGRFLSRMRVLNFDAEGMDIGLPMFLQAIAKKEKLRAKLDFGRICRDVNYNVRDAMMKLEVELMGAGYLAEGNLAGDLRASIRK